MPKQITACKVFIASAGGLEDFRREFRDVLNQFNSDEALHRGYAFFPIGWEDTVGGVGRPQEQINKELRECDYAVFMFRNRWGTPPSKYNSHSSGTEEEWSIANEQYKSLKLREIQGCFFPYATSSNKHEIEQHLKVVEFKDALVANKKFFFKSFTKDAEFGPWMRSCLSGWLRQLEKPMQIDERPEAIQFIANTQTQISSSSASDRKPLPETLFLFQDWNARALTAITTKDLEAACFYLNKAANSIDATSMQVAEVLYNQGVALNLLDRSKEAINAFDQIISQFEKDGDPTLRVKVAKAMINKGVTLDQLNKSEDAIAVYAKIISIYGKDAAISIREQVVLGMFKKGKALGRLNRIEEEIAIYDQVIQLYGNDTEAEIRKLVSDTRFYKCVRFGQLNRIDESIALYDQFITLNRNATEFDLKERTAVLMLIKGATLETINKNEDAIDVYDQVIKQYSHNKEIELRECVAKAMVNKGFTLGKLNRGEHEIAAYDVLIKRFGNDKEVALRAQVAKAMLHKGLTLSQLNRSEDAVKSYAEIIAKFGADRENSIREVVAKATQLKNK